MHLRKATLEDANLLFLFRNEEQTRQNSINQDVIKWEKHLSWLQKRIDSDQCRIYIAEENEIPIGQIRLDIERDTALISYSVDKPYRGKSYGKAILETMETDLKTKNNQNKTINLLRAEVKATNRASQKCFETLGYLLVNRENEILTYQKER